MSGFGVRGSAFGVLGSGVLGSKVLGSSVLSQPSPPPDTRTSHAVSVPRFVARVVVSARVRRGVGGPLLLALRHGGRGLRAACRPHRMSWSRSRCVEWRVHCGLPSDVVGRSRSNNRAKNERAITFLEVMALWLSSLLRSAWLHHPVHVGRLMPTLVRRRPSSRPRNMVSAYYATTVGDWGLGGLVDGDYGPVSTPP